MSARAIGISVHTGGAACVVVAGTRAVAAAWSIAR